MNENQTPVLIMGATGMLGSAVTKHLLKDPTLDVTALCREQSQDILAEYCPQNQIGFYDAQEGAVDQMMEDMAAEGAKPGGYIINCIGTIKPNIHKDVARAIYINSVLPWKLAQLAKQADAKLIHITTDCVFSGERGLYDETARHNEQDIYGRSKSLGEPKGECMVLRTSIIGPEVHNNSSLIAWVFKEATKGSKTIKGFADHYWNGITTDTYAKVVQQIISQDLWIPELRHIHSPNVVSKYQLVSAIVKYFGLSHLLSVENVESGNSIDRTLDTIYPEFLAQFNIPAIEQQLSQYEN